MSDQVHDVDDNESAIRQELQEYRAQVSEKKIENP